MKRIIIALTFMLFVSIPLNALAQDLAVISSQKESIKTITQNIDSQNKNLDSAEQGDVWLESLITDTPQEGRELAIKMARKSIAAVQTDSEVRKSLRKDYDVDTAQLVEINSVIAL